MIPLKLKEGIGVVAGVYERDDEVELLDGEVQRIDKGDEGGLKVVIKMDAGSTKRTSILNNLQKLNQVNETLIELSSYFMHFLLSYENFNM